MAVNQPLVWPEYTWNAARGLFTYIDAQGFEVTTDLETVTGGRFRNVGRAIQVVGDVPGLRRGQLLGSLSQVLPAHMVAYPGGRVVLFNQGPTDELTRERVLTGQYAVSARASVTLPTGEQRSIDITFAPVTRAGSSLVLRESEGQIRGWQYIDNQPDPRTGLPPDPPAGWRFASPREAILRALIGQLYSKQFGMLGDLARSGLVDENGRAIETESDAAAYLARIAYENVTGGWIGVL